MKFNINIFNFLMFAVMLSTIAYNATH